MAGRPLRPATDRRLGRPLPHQLANLISATPKTIGLAIPTFPPQGICGISVTFATLSPISGHVTIHYSPVRHSPPGASTRAAVRLACVKHSASVQSEPGSNSSVQSLQLLNTSLNSNELLHLSVSIYASCRPGKTRAAAASTPTPIGCKLLKINRLALQLSLRRRFERCAFYRTYRTRQLLFSNSASKVKLAARYCFFRPRPAPCIEEVRILQSKNAPSTTFAKKFKSP